MSVGKDLLSSVTGNTDKACLVVHDVRAQATAIELKWNSAGNFGQLGGSIGPATQRQSEHQNTLANTMKALQGNSDLASAVSGQAGQDKTFFVQFNPSSLQLYSSNQPDLRAGLNNTNSDQNAVADSVTAPQVDLTVQLIFDKMNIYDAFMFDKATSGASVTTATNIATLASDKTFTVQPYIEGLISALRNPYTQTMTFQWAHFSFTGRLRQLQANYTMFSVSGRPIRGVVQLRMKQDRNTAELQKWKSQFETLLMQKNALAAAGQKVSNLLNLSL